VSVRAIRTVARAALVAAAAFVAVALAASASAHLVEPPKTLGTPLTGTLLDMPGPGRTFLCWSPSGLGLTNASTPWVHGDEIHTSEIPQVEGRVRWGSARYTITNTPHTRHLQGNGLPSTLTGEFPVQPGSAAYPYYAALPAEGYENAAGIPIAPWDLDITIPRYPKPNPVPTCISKLTLGVAYTGAPWHVEIAPDSDFHLLNPSAGLPMDSCWGHPYATQYHYHGASWTCFAMQNKHGKHSPLVGYAIDGFGIYGINGVDGKPVKNRDLDACHGHTHKITWEGKWVDMYHYHLNAEYPYSIGCFRGTPAILPQQAS
jgi:hypothetical protein